MTHPEWFQQARRVDSAEVDVHFLLAEEFYFGPDSPDCLDNPKYHAALDLPEIPRLVPSMLRTTEILGNEHMLADYYKCVLQLAKHHKKKTHEISRYFWMRLWVWNTEPEWNLSFPWYDTLEEMMPFLTATENRDDGEVFWDADQGWELEAHLLEQQLFIRLRDPDSDETLEVISISREHLATQATAAAARARHVISMLSQAIGIDFWSRR